MKTKMEMKSTETDKNSAIYNIKDTTKNRDNKTANTKHIQNNKQMQQ